MSGEELLRFWALSYRAEVGNLDSERFYTQLADLLNEDVLDLRVYANALFPNYC